MTHAPDRRFAGFTLLELALGLAIIAVLAALALPIYRNYAERAQLAQLLLQVDQIATAVWIEDATGVRGLHQGALPGKAPPHLQVVPDASFNEPGGIRLLLIQAPAGFFASSPQAARYGLVADLTGTATGRRLRELWAVLPFDPGDKLWLAPGQLAFPLVLGAAPPSPPVPPPDPGTGWEASGKADGQGTWACQGTVSVAGTDGKPLTGVNAGVRIRVTLSVTTYGGGTIARTWNDQGNLAGGKASFEIKGLSADAQRGELVTGCKLEVLGVDYYYPPDPAIKWDGKLASTQVAPPSAARSATPVQAKR